MVYKIQSIEGSTVKDYLFERGGSNYIQDLRIKQEQPLTSFSIPGESATSTIILAFEGQKMYIDIDFLIVNDGIDADGGTDTGSTITVQQQIDYIKTKIFKAGISGISWKLYGDEFDSSGTEVAIESFDVHRFAAGKYAEGSFKLTVGSVT